MALVSVIEIHYTDDLSIFKVGVNRPINAKRVAAIADDMTNRKNMLPAYPIVVNENNEIIDGGHRFAAAQLAGIGMYYIVAPGLSVTDQAKANELTLSWSLLDWATFWSLRRDQGNWKEYVALLDLHAEFPMVVFSTLVSFTQYGGWSRESMKAEFKAGLFVVKDARAARDLCQMFTDFRNAGLPNNGALSGAVAGLYRNPDYDHLWMVKRMSQYPREVKPCINAREYLSAFQTLYNYDRPRTTRVQLVAL